MKLTLTTILTFILFLTPTPTHAISEPLSVPNNQFGIHIIDENDLQTAAELVNSNGGEWGYVTIVIREDDRLKEKWQNTFEKMRQLKLIPIVRLATRFENQYWIKPRTEDIEPWVDFLNSLNWVTKNRYIVLFNEPNHKTEWGGQINPVEYAQIANLFHTHLKAASDDFFVLPAGLDLAASNTSSTMHPKDFLEKMHQTNNQIFRIFDGWTSHSYPNPNFQGSPTAIGRNSIQGYLWEQQILKSLGLDKQLPIFITETGWAHKQGESRDSTFLSAEQTANYYKIAYNQVWNEKNIVAITPFVLNYPTPPFDHFSWTKPNSDTPYPQFHTVQQLTKTAGQPEQINDSTLVKQYFPNQILTNTQISIATRYQNTGQSIWDPDQVTLHITSSLNESNYSTDPVPITNPTDQAKIWINLKAPEEPGKHNITLQLKHNDQPFGEPITYTFHITKTNNILVRLKILIDRFIHHKNLLVHLYKNLQTT